MIPMVAVVLYKGPWHKTFAWMNKLDLLAFLGNMMPGLVAALWYGMCV